MEALYTKKIQAKTLTELEVNINKCIRESDDICLQAYKNSDAIYSNQGMFFEAELVFGKFMDIDPLSE
ncbi:MAG: hypothetical protein ACRDCZ_07790 [Culicoidibacterales bacterium]